MLIMRGLPWRLPPPKRTETLNAAPARKRIALSTPQQNVFICIDFNLENFYHSWALCVCRCVWTSFCRELAGMGTRSTFSERGGGEDRFQRESSLPCPTEKTLLELHDIGLLGCSVLLCMYRYLYYSLQQLILLLLPYTLVRINGICMLIVQVQCAVWRHTAVP